MKLLKIISLSGLLTFLRMISGFVVAKVIAIYVGPTGLALVGQLQSLVSSLSGLVSAPVGSGLVKYTAEYGSELHLCQPYWSAATRLLLIVLIFLLGISLIFTTHLTIWLTGNLDAYWTVFAVIVLMPLYALNSMISSILNGLQLYNMFTLVGVVSTVISTIFTIALIFMYGINGALLSVAFYGAGSGLVAFLMVFNSNWFKFSYFFGRFSSRELVLIGKFMLMAVTTAVCFPLTLIAVRSILAQHVSWEAAGHWQAVWKISEAYMSVVTIAFSTYLLPRLASAKSRVELRSEIMYMSRIVIPFMIASAFVIYFMRDIIVKILFSTSFYPARELFLYQLIGDVVKVASFLWAYPMISTGAIRFYMVLEVIFAVFFVVTTYFLVSIFGVDGANISYLITYVVYFLVVLVGFFKRWYNVGFF